MKARTLRQIVCKLAIAATIPAGLFAVQTYGASPCPQLPAGTASVTTPAGGFAIDGNLQANTPASGIGDWIPGPSGSGGFVIGTNGVPLNPTTTFHLTDPYNSGSDNNFKGGQKVDDNPNLWGWVSNPVNSKQDINNALIHFATDANGHNWIFVSADRRSTNGSAYIDFEFLQNPLTLTTNPGGTSGGFTSAGPNCGRTVNDFILTVSLSNGGSSASLCFSRWLASPTNACGYDYVDSSSSLPAGAVFAAVNTSPIPVPYGAFGSTTYSVNAIAEAAVDLTALFANIDPCLSVGIKSVLVKTKESPSPTATIVDFITPLAVNLKLGPTADAGPDQNMCAANGSATFTLNGTATAGIHPIVSMAWSVVSGTATIDPPTSCSNCMTLPATVHVSSSSATLRLTVIDSANCTKTDDVVLTIPSAISASETTTPVSCNGGSDGSVTVNVSGGTAPYSVTVNGVTHANVTSSTTFTGLASGTYPASITDAANCSGSATGVLVDQPAAISASETTNPVSCNGGSDGSVTVNVSGGTSPYSVTVNSVTHINVTSSTTFTGLASGTYPASISDAHSCPGSAAGVLVGQPTAISASETTNPVSCNGGSDGSVTVNVSGGTSPYSVTVNSVTHINVTSSTTFTGLASGTYPASISDASSCPGSAAGVLVGQPTALTLGLTQLACSNGNDGSISATFGGGTGPYMLQIDSGGYNSFTSPHTFSGLAPGSHTVDLKDASNCLKSAQLIVNACPQCNPLTGCTPPYPFTSSNPRTSIAFSESEVLRAFIVSVGPNCTPSQVQVFYNDEHALTLGIRQVNVKEKTGTTTTTYTVTPLTTNPGSATNPMVGSTTQTGDQAGVDVSGRPIFPSLFITDITSNPSDTSGDWQNGGTAISPHAVFGTWKGAVKLVDKTKNPNVTTVTPDGDPAKNNWNLGAGSDPVPAGLKNEGYGAEVRWDVSQLGLMSGHTYRLYFMVHDGDQNKAGGDSGQGCAILTMP